MCYLKVGFCFIYVGGEFYEDHQQGIMLWGCLQYCSLKVTFKINPKWHLISRRNEKF